MKKVDAQLEINLEITCPYCGNFLNIWQDLNLETQDEILKEGLSDLDLDWACFSCTKDFVINKIERD